LYSCNLLLLACCQRCSWWRHRQCINCFWMVAMATGVVRG